MVVLLSATERHVILETPVGKNKVEPRVWVHLTCKHSLELTSFQRDSIHVYPEAGPLFSEKDNDLTKP